MAFLSLCAGEWMTLRSQFALTSGDEDWHSSERSDLKVNLVPGGKGEIGGLQVTPQLGEATTLLFAENGDLTVSSGKQDRRQGRWAFWADGSVEMSFSQNGEIQLQERICFTKPNLRLRSTMVVDEEGFPKQASFCSEIRRVSKPIT